MKEATQCESLPCGSVYCGSPLWIKAAFTLRLLTFCWTDFFLRSAVSQHGGQVWLRGEESHSDTTNNVSSDGEITDRKLNERQAVFALVYSQSEKTFKCRRNVSHLPQAQAFNGTNNGDIVLKGKEERWKVSFAIFTLVTTNSLQDLQRFQTLQRQSSDPSGLCCCNSERTTEGQQANLIILEESSQSHWCVQIPRDK